MNKDTVKDTVEKRSVSAPPELFQAADERMADQLISSFSEYVRILIRADLQGKLKVPRCPEQNQVPAAAA